MYSQLMSPFTGTVRSDGIRRDADGAFVPADPRNADWQAYQAWLAAGNTPAVPVPAASPVPPP